MVNLCKRSVSQVVRYSMGLVESGTYYMHLVIEAGARALIRERSIQHTLSKIDN